MNGMINIIVELVMCILFIILTGYCIIANRILATAACAFVLGLFTAGLLFLVKHNS